MLDKKQLLDETQCVAKIKSIKSRLATLDNDIHLAACSALSHFYEHGNTRLLAQLVKATSAYNATTGKFNGRSARGADLRAWIRAHAAVAWSKKADNEKGSYIKDKDYTPLFDLDHALETPFYEARESVTPEYCDVGTKIQSMIKSMETLLKNTQEGMVDKTRVPTAQLALATNFVNNTKALFDDHVTVVLEAEEPLAADAPMVDVLAKQVEEEQKSAAAA